MAMKEVRVLAISPTASLDVEPGQARAPADRFELNVRIMESALAEAAAYRPDIVCFPETMLQDGLPYDRRMDAGYTVEADAPAVARLAAAARRLGSFVLVTTLLRDGGHVFNSALLLDPQGRRLGRYDKYQPTRYEMETGVRPGNAVPVWQTELGRIGCVICFDLKFPEIGLELARQQAQLVLFPTMFMGGTRLAAWARDFGFYLVRCHTSSGVVVDPVGNTVATEGPPVPLAGVPAEARLTFATVNTDRGTFHYDYHWRRLAEIRSRYAAEVEVHDMRHEALFNLESRAAGLSIDAVAAELNLMPAGRYFDNAREQRQCILAGHAWAAPQPDEPSHPCLARR
jgi:hypothetical protein